MSNILDFGAVGDGKADDTAAIQHTLDKGSGVIEFPRGTYRITRPLLVDLARHGRTSLDGSGGVAKLVMDGPGPAIFLRGTHSKTADPNGFQPNTWEHERMPTLNAIEIEGNHPEADGVRIEGVMQPTLTRVLIRRVRTAVHVTKRARNLLISHCHFYYNTGVGVHFDHCNLHQAIVTGSHVSYCRLGGIRIDGSEIRNFQITGNDIEYNNNRAHHEKFPDDDAVPTAEIYIDVGEGSVGEGSVREGTIAGNTIQASDSPNGANIRFIGRSDQENHKVGMWTISGNLIGSQTNNVHLTSAWGVTLAGNHIYSGHNRNLLVENSRNIVVGANCFGHNPDYRKNELCTGLRFVDSTACNISGTMIQEFPADRKTVPGTPPIPRAGLLELIRCRNVNVSGVQILEGAPYGIYLEDCNDTLISGCQVLDGRKDKLMKAAIRWKGKGTGNMITACRIGSGTEGTILAEKHVCQVQNLSDE